MYLWMALAVLVAQLPLHHVFTVHAVVGDTAGWLFVVAFVAIVGWAIFSGRRASHPTTGAPKSRPIAA
jgi:hypothetical protein